jgi:anion-transporting  ArsA/GET3 family ATPase
MSYAIYGESETYIHLVTADTESEVVDLFLEDIKSVNQELKNITNVYAVNRNQEASDLERYIESMIKEANNVA